MTKLLGAREPAQVSDISLGTTRNRRHLHGDDRQSTSTAGPFSSLRSKRSFKWDRADIQIAFTLFVLFETWLVPIEGWFVDKYGPRVVVFVSGILCGVGWWMTSRATHARRHRRLLRSHDHRGIGAGGVYGTCVGNALKWFPDKRGLAAGITAAGFGAGAALTVVPIQNMIRDTGFQNTFLYFGIGQGVIICLLAFLCCPSQGPGSRSHRQC